MLNKLKRSKIHRSLLMRAPHHINISLISLCANFSPSVFPNHTSLDLCLFPLVDFPLFFSVSFQNFNVSKMF
ncbi:hypothetical protein CIPAW_07G010700 [Carya illinoinensis]|uniref:Uncharacterized protein n=1 Tax=Carya illinoinensis TaxID=32201 RepID=A0A8T1PQJ3_CARIL|nr:hypothetical protein CIPAW_07G010700 [Carya illinoinensis]